MVNRVQANVVPLKVQGSIWPCREWSRFAHSRHPEWRLRMIAIHHSRCSAGGSINHQRPLRADTALSRAASAVLRILAVRPTAALRPLATS
jgi:hypothetical protein